MVYPPSTPLMVPIPVPLTRILTPGRVSPVVADVKVPVIWTFCNSALGVITITENVGARLQVLAL